MMSKNSKFQQIKRIVPSWFYIIKWLFICSIMGVLVGIAAAIFLITLAKTTSFRTIHPGLIWALPIGGFLVGLAYHYWGKEVVGGTNLIIDTIHQPARRIPFKMAPMVYLGTLITHLFGGSAGREGTAVQMAAAIGEQLFKPLRLNEQDRTILLLAAVAAGFAAVFGTPLAGTLFALEFFLIGKIRYKALFPALLGALIADTVAKMLGASHAHYVIPHVPELKPLFIIYALIVGLCCGLVAALFSVSMHKLTSFYAQKISYPPFRPLFGGALVACLILLFSAQDYMGLGLPMISKSFEMPLPYYTFALKVLFTVLTLSAGFKGGEVTPLFFIGAALGNALAMIIPLPMALLAGMGFVAVFAGATNTPLACTLMAMELFGTSCGVYVALACFTAYLCSGNNSIYAKQKIGMAKTPIHTSKEGSTIYL